MDLETKLELIKRPPTEEILTEEELRELLETKDHPIAYNGWEPSGLVHLGTGLLCAYKMKDLIEAGVRFKAYLACWHAWINNKFGGDLEKIKKAAKHFCHAWVSLGVPENKIEFIWPEEEYEELSYWNKVVQISKELTLARARRTLEIMGRTETDAKKVADFLYTPMQVADIFHFEIDICQLGMDQRKANVVAREVGPSLNLWKPICVHHHLLQGLSQPPTWPLPTDPLQRKEMLINVKMSKSRPKTCIWIYDKPEIIKEKISAAFCPEKIVEFNPVLDIAKYIIFREKKSFEIERSAKYGGSIEFNSYGDLVKEFREGKLHPLDLKNAVAQALIKILEPVREYFENNREARELYETVKKAEITR